jgi:hypothetical protein
MKRAKCRLCNKILEVHYGECISCACGEIMVDRFSNQFHATIKTDKSNLIFMDDNGNEIIPSYAKENGYETEIINGFFPGRPGNKFTVKKSEPFMLPGYGDIDDSSKHELLDTLDAMAQNVANLPQEARGTPITHSDFGALLSLLSSLFRSS